MTEAERTLLLVVARLLREDLNKNDMRHSASELVWALEVVENQENSSNVDA